ncbi:MAG: hypothetical protein ACKPAJ_04515, partial [Actinomycetota bacterium]
MTHFHSRPYTEAGQLNNLAKVFALIQIVDENSVKQIDLHSNDEQLIRTVEQISERRNIKIHVFDLSEPSPSHPWRSRVKSRIPRPVLAMLALSSQLKVSLALKHRGVKSEGTGLISIFDYWYRFARTAEQGRFASQYWSTLVDRLDRTKVNWWHNLVDQTSLRQLKHAKKLCDRFNDHANHRHELNDSLIDSKIL